MNISPKLIQLIVDSLELKTTAAKDFLFIALENAVLFDKKQMDYGPKNMSGFGSFGVIVRASDKFERIKHLFNNRRSAAVNESIEDSYRDISNYMIIALMLESGKWPDYVPTALPPRRRKKPTNFRIPTTTNDQLKPENQPFDHEPKT